MGVRLNEGEGEVRNRGGGKRVSIGVSLGMRNERGGEGWGLGGRFRGYVRD